MACASVASEHGAAVATLDGAARPSPAGVGRSSHETTEFKQKQGGHGAA